MRRIGLDALLSSAKELSELRELLARGGVVALPTETFYALAANPVRTSAVSRVCAIKGRETTKALPVLFGERRQLEWLGVTASPALLDHYFQLWPAPLTVVFRLRESLAASLGRTTLGVRLPAEGRLRRILQATGPLTGTSVNRSGRPPLEDPDAIESLFLREIDVLIDGGRTPGGKPSTIVDATVDPPALLRSGAFAWPVGA